MYLSRNYENLNFIGLKSHILETKFLKEKIAQNDPRKKSNVLKKVACYQQHVSQKLFLEV